MYRWSVFAVALLLLAQTGLPGAPVPPDTPTDFSKLKDETIQRWAGADVLLLGKFTQTTAGPVGLSSPPFRTYRLQITPGKILRGSPKIVAPINASYAVRQEQPAVFPGPNTETLIALKLVRNAWVLIAHDEATAEKVAQVKLATALPIGWTVRDGKLLSPWAAVGNPGKGEGVVCSVTGRPALLAGNGVIFDVEPVPPAVKHKFKNPDGDGEFRLIVKNDTDKEITVPALLTDGKTINWTESIVLRTQGKTYTLPGSTGHLTGLKAVVLKPGEEVSGTVNAFVMDGPAWPRGGSRIEFQFILGEKSATHSFYYFSSLHDPIREKVQKGLKK